LRKSLETTEGSVVFNFHSNGKPLVRPVDSKGFTLEQIN